VSFYASALAEQETRVLVATGWMHCGQLERRQERPTGLALYESGKMAAARRIASAVEVSGIHFRFAEAHTARAVSVRIDVCFPASVVDSGHVTAKAKSDQDLNAQSLS
jgi:hypothetical protein